MLVAVFFIIDISFPTDSDSILCIAKKSLSSVVTKLQIK